MYTIRLYKDKGCPLADASLNMISTSDPFDFIPDINYCLSDCLDIDGCRFATYNKQSGQCSFYRQKCSLVADANYNSTERVCLTPGVYS